jgi:hypothetical protein
MKKIFLNKIFKFLLKTKGIISFFFEFFFPLKMSPTNVDVIITVHPKDIQNLEKCIYAVKINLLHKVKNFFIISQYHPELKKIITKNSCTFIEENKVLNKDILKINYKYKNLDRSNWLYQQLLNYQAVISLGDSDLKFAINSDTILSKKQKFKKGNKLVLNVCDSYYLDHLFISKKLLNINNFSNYSFTSHHIMYSKKYLMEMLNLLETKFKKRWYNAILDNLDYSIHSNHSEFETYGQYVMNRYKSNIKLEYWFNKTMFANNRKKIKNIFNCFFYKSLSFHSWIDKNY